MPDKEITVNKTNPSFLLDLSGETINHFLLCNFRLHSFINVRLGCFKAGC